MTHPESKRAVLTALLDSNKIHGIKHINSQCE